MRTRTTTNEVNALIAKYGFDIPEVTMEDDVTAILFKLIECLCETKQEKQEKQEG